MEQRSGQNLSLCLAFPNVSIIQAHMLQGQDRKIPAHTWATFANFVTLRDTGRGSYLWMLT